MRDDLSSRSGRPLSILFGLCSLTLLLGTIRGASIPYWGDELATVHISEAPSWTGMIARSRATDLNPPLEFALVRMSLDVFGPHEFAGRLPSIASFALVVGCAFLYLRRRSSDWFAAFGALLLLYNQEISYYATEARPYALLLAMLGVALLSYDSILQGANRPWIARAVLLLGLTGMLLSHIFGLFAIGAFLLAEGVRSLRQQKFDLATWFVLLLPLGICVLYLPLLRAQAGLVYPEEMHPSVLRGLLLYNSFLWKPVAPVLEVGALLLLLQRVLPERSFWQYLRLRAEAWILLAVLLATPLTVALALCLHSPEGSFFPRYTLPMVYPAIFLIVMFFSWRSRESKTIGKTLTFLTLAAVLFSFIDVFPESRHLLHRGLLAAPDEVASDGGVTAIAPDLPLVDNNALRFMEADSRLSSADLSRFMYVTDKDEALRAVHSNAGESVSAMAKAYHLRSRVVPYADFIAAYRQFLVIGEVDHVGDWFLKTVISHGADAKLLGKFHFAGRDQSLWLVTLKPISGASH